MNYKEYISFLREHHRNQAFLNSDSEKRKAAYLELIKLASTDIRIFAGNFSDEVTNCTEIVEAISDFIEKGGHLRIVLNHYEKGKILESNFYKRLLYYIKNGKTNIEISQTSIKATLMHDNNEIETHFFIVDNKAYRLETDQEKKTAVCNMNNPETAQELTNSFDTIWNYKDTSALDLTDVFSPKNTK